MKLWILMLRLRRAQLKRDVAEIEQASMSMLARRLAREINDLTENLDKEGATNDNSAIRQQLTERHERTDALQAKVGVLESWARKRGHWCWCDIRSGEPCDCGLSDALAAAKEGATNDDD